VVGLLVAALYDPVWRVGIESPADLAVALAALLALAHWSVPPWIVVIATALVSGLLRTAIG
jgi:chromate transporter